MNSFDCSFNSTSISLSSDNTDPNVSTFLNEYENTTSNLEDDPTNMIKNIKEMNTDRIITAHLNINSIGNKFDALKSIISGNIDILLITETKLDKSFPHPQFASRGHKHPFRLDRTADGGGLMIFVRDDIPCKRMNTHKNIENFECIFFEIRLRKTNWLFAGGYNPRKENINDFLNYLSTSLDHYMGKYDNIFIMGDFNSEVTETEMTEFCETYNLTNLIKEPTCFKNPRNPSSIDILLTNRPMSFKTSKAIETGLSDYHKMTITVMKSVFKKLPPHLMTYRDYKKFNVNLFRVSLRTSLADINEANINYATFQRKFMEILNEHAPMKERLVRANNAPFMNKTLSKAVMHRSRLRNNYLKNPTNDNKEKYRKYRNYCVNLFKQEKKDILSKLRP